MDYNYQKDDHCLVRYLIANDNGAWRYVAEELVNPLIVANVKGIRDMLSRYSIDSKSVVGKVYEGLSARNWRALHNFRFECSFKVFIYWRVYDAVQRLLRETMRVDDKKMVSLDVDESDENRSRMEIADTKNIDPIGNILKKEAVVHANKALSILWKKNPVYALVLLMRNDLKLPSKEVALILDRKANTVDQINIRAQAQLRKIRDEIKS